MATLIKERRIAAESRPSPEARVLRVEPGDDLAAIARELDGVARIEVNVPKFGDGRGYSIGRLLRERYGYRGELRAVGQVARDLLLYMESCGFDSYELREGEDAEEALAGFRDFTTLYQDAKQGQTTLFRYAKKRGASLISE